MVDQKQTLIDAEVQQINDQTILKFKKFLEEDGENTINSKEMTRFIYAIGKGQIFSFHEHSGVFELDIRGCPTKRLVKFNYKQGKDLHIFLIKMSTLCQLTIPFIPSTILSLGGTWRIWNSGICRYAPIYDCNSMAS